MFSSARRSVWLRHRPLALATAAVACLAAPLADADAATRYASPTGTGTAPCLEPTAPCTIEEATAFPNTTNGDTILLAPGTYHPTVKLEVGSKVTISGEPGKPAPLIEAGPEDGLFLWEPSTVRDIRIQSPPGTTAGLETISNGNTIERVESVGEANVACVIAGVVRDTLCSATPVLGGGEGVSMFRSGSTPETLEANLFNVTAIGGSVGIFAGANQNSTVILNATNTIASGGQNDISAGSHALTAPVTINLSHSNFESVETEGTEVHVTSPTAAGNQTAPPLFTDAATGDYTEQATSPTRLAGDLAVVLPGEVDLAGQPRTTNCAGTIGVDIGAFQFECPTPPADNGGSSGGGSGNSNPPPPLAKIAPRLSNLALTPKRFVAGPGKLPKGTARGTVVSFTLSAPAAVKLEVLGKRTVKGKKPKTVTLGSLPPVSDKTGVNKVKFNGKLKGKPLEPGKYTLQVTATAAGISSKPLTKTFEVLAPAS